MRLVCVGDSITAGQYCEVAWPQFIRGFEVVNKGVSNDTTRLGLERFPKDVQALEPAVVVIQFGHNDANCWETDRGLPRVSRAAYKANLAEMVERTATFGARPVLCSLTPTLRNGVYERNLAAYDDALWDVSEALSVPVVPVRGRFMAYGTTSLLLDDGLHLSRAGHELYADCVSEVLERVLVAA